jgi:hypothetical protein
MTQRVKVVPTASLVTSMIDIALAQSVARPVPRGGLFESDEPLASRVDELLEGFGER